MARYSTRRLASNHVGRRVAAAASSAVLLSSSLPAAVLPALAPAVALAATASMSANGTVTVTLKKGSSAKAGTDSTKDYGYTAGTDTFEKSDEEASITDLAKQDTAGTYSYGSGTYFSYDAAGEEKIDGATTVAAALKAANGAGKITAPVDPDTKYTVTLYVNYDPALTLLDASNTATGTKVKAVYGDKVLTVVNGSLSGSGPITIEADDTYKLPAGQAASVALADLTTKTVTCVADTDAVKNSTMKLKVVLPAASGDTTLVDTTVTYDSDKAQWPTVAANLDTQTGKNFVGFSTNRSAALRGVASSTGYSYANKRITLPIDTDEGEDVTLYAVYATAYTVTYKAGATGVKGTVDPLDLTVGGTKTVSDNTATGDKFEREHYHFAGWTTTSGSHKISVAAGANEKSTYLQDTDGNDLYVDGDGKITLKSADTLGNAYDKLTLDALGAIEEGEVVLTAEWAQDYGVKVMNASDLQTCTVNTDADDAYETYVGETSGPARADAVLSAATAKTTPSWASRQRRAATSSSRRTPSSRTSTSSSPRGPWRSTPTASRSCGR